MKLILSLLFITSDITILFSQVSIDWVKYYHSGQISSHEEARSLAVDDSRNVYVAAQGSSSTTNVYKILKYTPNGDLISQNFYSGGTPVKILSSGLNDFFVAGTNGLYSLSPGGNFSLIEDGRFVDIIKGEGNSFYTISQDSGSLFTNKYNYDGSLIWSKIMQGGQGYAYSPLRIFQGVDNNIHVIGRFNANFSTVNIYLLYDTNGNYSLFWDSFPGSIIVTGDSFSNFNFLTGSYKYSLIQSDIVLYKTSWANSILDTVLYNGAGNGHDQPNDIACDNAGNVYIACKSWGAAVDYDFVVLKFNSDLELVWEYRYNGSQNSFDSADKLKLDNNGNVFASGTVTLNAHGIQIYTVKLSPNGQLMWSHNFGRYNSSIDTNYVKDLQLFDSHVYICGKSRDSVSHRFDIMTLKYSDQTSSINSGLSIPFQYNFIQNYPNPFNPETTIKFNLPYRSAVKIEILSSTGKKIDEVANAIYTEGEHSIIWDGGGYPSGVYFILFRSDNFKEVKKAVLIK